MLTSGHPSPSKSATVGAPPKPSPGIGTTSSYISPPGPTSTIPFSPLMMSSSWKTLITSGPSLPGRMSATATKPDVNPLSPSQSGTPPGCIGSAVIAWVPVTTSGRPSRSKSATTELDPQPGTSMKSRLGSLMSWPFMA